MKKIFLILTMGLCFTGFSSETNAVPVEIDMEPIQIVCTNLDVKMILEMISNLNERVSQIERSRRALGAARIAREKPRVRSKLMITPEARDGMNLLGERFPKHAIRLDTLPSINGSKVSQKPYVATPKIAPYVPQEKKEETK